MSEAGSTEIWCPVRGYEGIYEASSLGRIRRIGRGGGATPGRLKNFTPHSQGYLAVTLYVGNQGRTSLVHRVIAEVFIGPIQPSQEVNHRDGNKQNNRIENLEIVSRQENIDHAVRTGLIANKGELNSQAIITDETAAAIIADHAAGMGYKRLAKKYEKKWGQMRYIASGKGWKHLPRPVKAGAA
jgi:hypothetical protein